MKLGNWGESSIFVKLGREWCIRDFDVLVEMNLEAVI